MDEYTQQRLLWVLVLQRLTFSNSRRYQLIWERCQSLEQFYALSEATISTLFSKSAIKFVKEVRQLKKRSGFVKKAESDLVWIEQQQIKLITLNDDSYPEKLKCIDAPPPVLMVQGNISLLHKKQVAIVGSRRASPGGISSAELFASSLTRAGLVVSSGLALGIDAAAHRGALEQSGETVAVVATGLDTVYPSRHRRLAEEVIKKGAIISEFPLRTPAKKENFPRRNRIISGLSEGVLVVEAELKSGSLITSRYALEQGRDVWAIPGSPKQPGAKGCNDLIRHGAGLVESPEDVLHELELTFAPRSPSDLPSEKSNVSNLCDDEKKIFNYLSYEPLGIDELVQRTGLDSGDVSALLINLEIQGLVDLLPEGYCLK